MSKTPSETGSVTTENEVLERVASALSHDVRTPVRHISHFLDFLLKALNEPLSPEAQEHLQYIETGLASTNDMIETLVEYARMADQFKERDACQLAQLLLEAMANTREALDAEDVSFSVNGDAEVRGSSPLLINLFMDVFENAILFCPEDRAAQILVSISEDEPGMVTVRIEDNGDGVKIDPSAAFRMFQRGRILNSPLQGEGIGLAFALRAAELHGGTLTLSPDASALGGACFVLRLPVQQDA